MEILQPAIPCLDTDQYCNCSQDHRCLSTTALQMDLNTPLESIALESVS